jgi:hypothetical protein
MATISGAAAAALQAWTVSMLMLINDAYSLGVVCGAGLRLGAGATAHEPSAAVLRAADGAPLLIVDVFEAGVSQTRLNTAWRAVSTSSAVEYWQLVAADPPIAHLLQRDGARGFSDTPPDARGIHYSLINEELRFPAAWFAERPMIVDMMAAWGMVDDE